MKTKFMIAGMMALCSSLTAQWNPPTGQLIDSWEFTNSSFVSGINANSPLNAPATLPTFTTDRCGDANSALHFDPSQSQHLEYATAGLPLGSGARSVSFWMRTANTVTGGANVKALVAYGRTHNMPVLPGNPANNAGGTFEINHNYCSNGVGFDVTNQAITRTLTCLTNNVWHHVVAIWSPSLASQSFSNIIFWVDGVLINSPSCYNTGGTQQVLTQASSLFFGSNCNIGGVRRYFDGDMDDIYMYSRALTPTEVQVLFNAKCGITGPTCILPNQSYNFSTTNYLNALSYNWTVPSGWTGMTGGTTNNMNVTSGATGGNIQVTINTGCGNIVRTLPVVLGPNCSSVVPEPTVVVSSGCCLGNECSHGANPLASDYEIPLNNFNFNFSGNLNDKVNVGYNCSNAGLGKLNAFTDKLTNQSMTGAESISIFGNNLFNDRKMTGVGVMGLAANFQGGPSIGVWGDATGSGNNTGGRFFAGGGDGAASGYNIGVSGVALPTTGAPAPHTYTISYPIGANIGVYGAGELFNSPDINNPGPDWAGWFDGDVNVVGNCFWNLSFQFSDKRLKKDIKVLENTSDKIMKLSGYTYGYKADEFKFRGFDHKKHIGLIAQEVKEVFPELIAEDAQGFLAVDYQGMIPVLLQVAKEQQNKLRELENRLLDQQLQMDEQKKLNAASGINKLTIEAGYALSQNEPNPFSHETVIKFTLPASVNVAYMAVYDLTGKQINSFPLSDRNNATITITSEKLPAGIYIYSIIADGKVIDSKRMIVAEK